MAKPQTWGSPIWGFTRPYPGTNTYGPGGPAPSQSPPPSYSTARRLPPSFPPVNLNDEDDEVTDEDRELLELTGGIPTPGPRPTPTPPPGGAGIYPDTATNLPPGGAFDPNNLLPGYKLGYVPQKDPVNGKINWVIGPVRDTSKVQAPPNLQSVAHAGERYTFNPQTNKYTPSGLPGPQPPPGGVNPKQYVDDAGTTHTWAENDAGQIINGTYRVKPVERPGDQYKPVPATWHPEDTGIPGMSRYYAKDAEGKEVPGTSQLIRQPQAPEPRWVSQRQAEETGDIPGAPGSIGKWIQTYDYQYDPNTGKTRKIPIGEGRTLVQESRNQADIEGQQLAAKEAAEKAQQQRIQADIGARKAAEMSNPRSWINNALQAGQTPSVPPRLAGIIGQAPGTPLQKKPPVMPTADMWRTLTDADKDALFGYLSWVGIDPQEWMMQLSRQWAPWGAGAPDMGARFGVVRQR